MIASESVLSEDKHDRLRRKLGGLAAPYVLFPLFALILVIVIWGMFSYVVRKDRARAMHSAALHTQELAGTYEAQVLRSLMEIEHELRLVSYSYENRKDPAILRELGAKNLLLPDLLFSVIISDKNGNVIASYGKQEATNIADLPCFASARTSKELCIGISGNTVGEYALLRFGRSLRGKDGSFDGFVMVSVPYIYFVSAYGPSQLGKDGIIGLLGADGTVHAERTGKTTSVGGKLSMAGIGEDNPIALVSWAGMPRFTATRKLYGFPLVAIVGLSWREQLADFHHNERRYFWMAAGRSIAMILFAAILARITWQLEKVRSRAEQNLRISAAAFESQQAMMITDEHGVIQQINSAYSMSTGYEPWEIIGKIHPVFEPGERDMAVNRKLWEEINTKGAWEGETWDRRKDGTVFPKWTTISSVRDDRGRVTHYVYSHYDITEIKESEKRIKHLAYFDQLTGLPNRTLLIDRLTEIMNESQEEYGALLFIDLDNFKTLNDTLGHHMGDLLLKQVGKRLAGSVRAGDILARLEPKPDEKPPRAGDMVARLGGDEFVLVLTSLSRDKAEAAAQTAAIGKKILDALNKPYQLKDIEYHSTPSIGATLFLGQQTAVEDLMKQADLAMYRSKAAGRNSICFFDPSMGSALIERTALEEDLRRAVEDKQFQLYYQAQVAQDGHIIGAEALLRWQHPMRGMVMPSEFIALAEESKLILSLGNWVMDAACAQLAAWSKHPEMMRLSLSVNVSAQQFHQQDFVDQVKSILEKTRANPSLLQLELTESLLLANVGTVVQKMTELKAIGVGFSLDDFGTGYSSLSYLKRLPLDHLKIDRSFVRDVLTNPNDAAIANTIIALAKTLGLGVIAEGVESESQRDFLSNAGCSIYQGYFFCLPMPLAEFELFAKQSAFQTECFAHSR